MRREIDYSLARRAVIRDLERGIASRADHCDAHPELLRAARHIGTEVEADCPVCTRTRLRRVSYAYGDCLKAANGRALLSAEEVDRMATRYDEFTCYVVEVCTECSWNYLVRSFLAGRRHAG